MKTLLLLFLLGTNTPDDYPTLHCERAEQNFFYDDEGCLVFEQWIFRNWDSTARAYVCHGWRISSNRTDCARKWSLHDGHIYGPAFRVRAPFVDQSWTQYDPELEDRERFPVECRRLPADHEVRR